MSAIPLLEGVKGAMPFLVDRTTRPVTESRNGFTVTRIPGRFSICDSVNGNNRRYPKKVWEKNLAEGSALRQMIAKNAAFGLLEHPANGQISLNSPICILVTEAQLKPGQDKDGKSLQEVIGEIMVLGTAEGQKLSALIDVGYNPLVSSRGFGSVVKDSQGVDEVQDDYICEGWDVVLKPSFETAELWPDRSEKKEESKPEKADKSVTEDKVAPKPTVLKEELPPATPSKPSNESIMTINEIKSRINSFRALKVPADPQRFAEGMNEMAAIHQDIANYVSEDTKRSWQGTQLHNEVQGIERGWGETALNPAKQAGKLTESYKKALKVTKAIGEAAVNFKKKLSEAIKQNAEASTLIEQLTERGQAWVALADKRKATLEEIEHKLNVTCESLEIVAGQYHTDVTTLGKRVIQLEFKEKADTEEIQKLLKEAKHPKHILAIREKLDPKSKEEKKDESKDEKKDDKAAEAKKDESKKDEKKDESKKPVNEDKKDESNDGFGRVLVPSVRSVTESVDMVKRLSASAK